MTLNCIAEVNDSLQKPSLMRLWVNQQVQQDDMIRLTEMTGEHNVSQACFQNKVLGDHRCVGKPHICPESLA